MFLDTGMLKEASDIDREWVKVMLQIKICLEGSMAPVELNAN